MKATFHESLNIAGAFNLPIVYVCENNLYAVSTRQSRVRRVEDIADRSVGYGMPGVVVDGNDVMAVYETCKEAVQRARSGAGPTLVECKTYRWRAHFEGEVDTYRPPEEVEAWLKREPIAPYEKLLVQQGVATEAELKAIKDGVIKELEEAVEFARQSPLPAPETAMADVWAYLFRKNENYKWRQTMRQLFYNQALCEGLAEEMRRDKNVTLWGIDIGPYGGANGVTKGLWEEFGQDRVMDMPVAELGYVGMGVGAAATGLRPVIELQFSDWITLTMEMIVNQAAKMHYMFGGILEMPLVIRAPIGGYLSAGAQHSNSFEILVRFCARDKGDYPIHTLRCQRPVKVRHP